MRLSAGVQGAERLLVFSWFGETRRHIMRNRQKNEAYSFGDGIGHVTRRGASEADFF